MLTLYSNDCQEALELLQTPNATDAQISGALAAIKLLVESIDNANGEEERNQLLHGGFEAIQITTLEPENFHHQRLSGTAMFVPQDICDNQCIGSTDMKALGGIEPVVSFLERGPPFDGQAAYVLGTAAANNPTFQKHAMEAFPDILDKLIAVYGHQPHDCPQNYHLDGASVIVIVNDILLSSHRHGCS